MHLSAALSPEEHTHSCPVEVKHLIGQGKGGCATLFSPLAYAEETLPVAEEGSRTGMNAVIWASCAGWAMADWSEL